MCVKPSGRRVLEKKLPLEAEESNQHYNHESVLVAFTALVLNFICIVRTATLSAIALYRSCLQAHGSFKSPWALNRDGRLLMNFQQLHRVSKRNERLFGEGAYLRQYSMWAPTPGTLL